MKEGIAGKAIYRKDYAAYPWEIGQLDLYFLSDLKLRSYKRKWTFN